MNKLFVVISVAILLAAVNTGVCLKCYDCQSSRDPACINPKQDGSTLEPITCTTGNLFGTGAGGASFLPDDTEFTCVKTTAGGQQLLTRACAIAGRANPCNVRSLIPVYDCSTCDEEDGCNGN